MKTFKQFIFEKATPEELGIVISAIRRDCAYWLSISNRIAVFRGFQSKAKLSNTLNKLTVRDDRKPRDSSPRLHKIMDDFLNDEFGFPFRSKGLFVTPSENIASNYAMYNKANTVSERTGNVCLIFPIGNFDYCFSRKLMDVSWHIVDDLDIEEDDPEYEEKIYEFLKSDEVEYVKNEQLDYAVDTRREIMLSCKEYYAVPIRASNIAGTKISYEDFIAKIYE